MTTIKEIAKIAHVSGATVSRVINNSPHVKDETRKKVLETIEKLNYQPNSLARGMRLKKTNTIGLLLANTTNPFYAEIAQAVVDIASKYNYTVILCITNNDSQIQKKHIKILQQKKVDGFLFASVLLKDPPVRELIETGAPNVLFNRIFSSNENINYVVQDNELGTYMAVEHLIKNGHKRIAFINGYLNFSTFKQRLNGYLKALKEYNINYDKELVVAGGNNEEKAFEATQKLLSLEQLPTAIVCSNDSMALSSLEALNLSNLKVPEDISLMGFHDIDIAKHKLIQLSTVSINKYLMAEIATKSLIQIIEGDHSEATPIQIVLKPQLIIRKSCGCC
jgi:LacI family transcriptional regulator